MEESDFIQKFSKIRLAEGLTRKEIGKLLGISESSVVTIENRNKDLNGTIIKKLAQLFPKYSLWLISDAVNLKTGQISPHINSFWNFHKKARKFQFKNEDNIEELCDLVYEDKNYEFTDAIDQTKTHTPKSKPVRLLADIYNIESIQSAEGWYALYKIAEDNFYMTVICWAHCNHKETGSKFITGAVSNKEGIHFLRLCLETDEFVRYLTKEEFEKTGSDLSNNLFDIREKIKAKAIKDYLSK